MGCVGIGLAFLLALAVPASIARTSLVGADVVIVLIAAVAVGAALVLARRRAPAGPDEPARSTRGWVVGICVAAVAYLAVVTVIHGV